MAGALRAWHGVCLGARTVGSTQLIDLSSAGRPDLGQWPSRRTVPSATDRTHQPGCGPHAALSCERKYTDRLIWKPVDKQRSGHARAAGAPESSLRSSPFFRGVTVEAASAAGVGATAIAIMATIEVGITIDVRASSAEPIASARLAPRRGRRNTASRGRPCRCGTP